MQIKQNLVSSNKYNVKCPHSMSPIGVCIHNTYNDAPASNEISYMKNNNNQVSFHIAVDDKEAIQAIPFNRNAWAAGDGGSGTGNRKYIHIEICYSKSGGTKFKEAENNAVKVVASILKNYGWGIDKVKAHKDFAKKNCPHRTNMNEFKDLLKKELAGSSSPQIYKYKNGSYNCKARVVTGGSNLNVRNARGTNSSVIGKFKDGQIINVEYCLNNWFSTWSLGKEGYVSGDYLELID